MKHNSRVGLRTEYSEIIQPIQISKYYTYAYCTCSVIAVHKFKYSTNMLNSGGAIIITSKVETSSLVL